MILYRAHTVAPVSRPPIADGAVLVGDGRIVAAGPWSFVRRAAPPGARARDLGRVVVTPGLVNAHTHLELSAMAAARLPAGDYTAWVRALVEARGQEDPGARRGAAAAALAFMRRRGTVAVGDVANEGWTLELIQESGLAGVVFHEVFGFRSEDAAALLDSAAARVVGMRERAGSGAAKPVRVALAPHAPHTTSATLLKAIAAQVRAEGAPLSIHVAESEAECRLLDDGSGPLPAFFRERGVWDEAFRPPGTTPVAYLDRLGLLDGRTLVVHGVQVGAEDREILQNRGCTVVACPRSNETLGVGTAPLAELARGGIPIALGTDSLASAPDLDLFAEMAAVRRLHSSLDPAAVLRMATLNGARALGLQERAGTIEAGKTADLLAVPFGPGQAPMEALCDSPPQVHRLDAAPYTEPSWA